MRIIFITFSFFLLIKCIYANELTCSQNDNSNKSILEKEQKELVDSIVVKILPEILNLQDGQVISKKIIHDNDSRSVGLSIVARIDTIEAKRKPDTKNLYDFYNDSVIQMAFFDKIFDSIRRGCFKNQFQTGRSNASFDPEFRVKTEKDLAGIGITSDKDPKSLSHHVRPKYAYFVPTKEMRGVRPNEYRRSYGNIYASFKNSIKDRTTFSEGDSIEFNLKARSLKRKADYKAVRRDLIEYWEAQIWGDVCFSDVEYFLVDCPFTPPAPAISEATLVKMKETGIPVYQCGKEKRGDNEIFVKTKILIEEDLEKRQLDEALINPK
jgi:hypothetical protein